MLTYEHAVRKHAARLINQEGRNWTIALREASKDGTVKERNFTTPLALYAKRPTPPWRNQEQPPPPKQPKGLRFSHASRRDDLLQVQVRREVQGEEVQVQARVWELLLPKACPARLLFDKQAGSPT